MHAGHWLGMTVHDSANVSHDSPLQPGVCLTIEPGLYFPDRARFGRYAGIGVRCYPSPVLACRKDLHAASTASVANAPAA